MSFWKKLFGVKGSVKAKIDVSLSSDKTNMSLFGCDIHDAVWDASLARVTALLERNEAAVNAKGRDDATPLHWAARKGCKEVAELLIAKGANVNAKDDRGKTPLHWAATWNSKDLAELLLAKGANVNAKDNCRYTALHDVRSRDVAKLLLDKGADVHTAGNGNYTPLFSNAGAKTLLRCWNCSSPKART